MNHLTFDAPSMNNPPLERYMQGGHKIHCITMQGYPNCDNRTE